MTDGASQGEYGSPQPDCGPVYPVVPDDFQPLRAMKIGTHPRNRLAASAAGGAAAISAMTFLFMSLQRGAAQRGDPYSLWNTLYHFIEMITAHGRFGAHCIYMDISTSSGYMQEGTSIFVDLAQRFRTYLCSII